MCAVSYSLLMGIVVAKEEKEDRSRDWPFLRCCCCETDQEKADHPQVMESLRFSRDRAKDSHYSINVSSPEKSYYGG